MKRRAYAMENHFPVIEKEKGDPLYYNTVLPDDVIIHIFSLILPISHHDDDDDGNNDAYFLLNYTRMTLVCKQFRWVHSSKIPQQVWMNLLIKMKPIVFGPLLSAPAFSLNYPHLTRLFRELFLSLKLIKFLKYTKELDVFDRKMPDFEAQSRWEVRKQKALSIGLFSDYECDCAEGPCCSEKRHLKYSSVTREACMKLILDKEELNLVNQLESCKIAWYHRKWHYNIIYDSYRCGKYERKFFYGLSVHRIRFSFHYLEQFRNQSIKMKPIPVKEHFSKIYEFDLDYFLWKYEMRVAQCQIFPACGGCCFKKETEEEEEEQ
jgi:hypothetical protein